MDAEAILAVALRAIAADRFSANVADNFVRLLAEAMAEQYRAPAAPKAVPAASPNRAKGGHARAAALSPERRSEIAAKAAAERWHGGGVAQ